MKNMSLFFLIAVFFLLSGCYPGINGKVVDGVNGNPLEGALVLAQWTTTSGLPGLTHHNVYQIEETETDKEGKFSISGVYNPFVDPPAMVIYKKGYVPWRNDMDFMNPTWERYNKNIWQDDLTYRLDHWKEEYSKNRLDGFIQIYGVSSETPKFRKVYSETYDDAYKEIQGRKSKKQ